ncbi:4Fe-4S binding protein, partial [Planktomarina temperata]|nr:4Fe-4S binding protein [Planktomarina temperata]
MSKTLILCDCLSSQTVDAAALSKATGLACAGCHTSLCTSQIDIAAKAIKAGDVVIACLQEAQRFAEVAEELEVGAPQFIDIRDRAGWTDDTAPTTPKMAALIADGMLPEPTYRSVDVISEGTCLITGAPDVALATAQSLVEVLSVTVLLTSGEDIVPTHEYDVVLGKLKQASGTIGQFEVKIDSFQQSLVGGRGTPGLTAPRDGALSHCDIILDLTGGTPLFPAPEKRDGYLRADPKSQPAVAHAVFTASQLVGTFEKPLYVRMEPTLCAHSRAEKPACSNCLNVCPTGAIVSAGEHVSIDPMICAGCGACAAVCPSGAISYDMPTVDHIFRRINTLATAYRNAGGKDATLLVHDDHGAEMISLSARHGRGLPAHVIPMEVNALSGFGHAEILAALASGFAAVDILVGPKTERDALDPQLELALAIAPEKASILDISDPDALSDHLFGTQPMTAIDTPILPLGTRRQVARLAAKALNPTSETIALP